jgi:hypothetical protein
VNWLNGIRLVLVLDRTELKRSRATNRIGTMSQGANRGFGVPDPPPAEPGFRLKGFRSFGSLSGIVHQSSHRLRSMTGRRLCGVARRNVSPHSSSARSA